MTMSFPVLVTDTREHIIWVEAADPDAALKRASCDTYEWLDPETLSSGYMSCRLPADKWDWDNVYGGGGDSYQGLPCDAHVETHLAHVRAVERKAAMVMCAAAGHVDNLHTWASGAIECQLCRVYTYEPPKPDRNIYLVWSNDAGSWWGPNGGGYTGNVWEAGRYNRDEAVKACGMRTWSLGAPPPEVMLLAPENGQRRFTVDDLRALPALMERRIAEATAAALATRAVSV